jgi:hypothetical protein
MPTNDSSFHHPSSFLFEFECKNNTVGWSWQGGLAGTAGGRLYGMCVRLLALALPCVGGCICMQQRILINLFYLILNN